MDGHLSTTALYVPEKKPYVMMTKIYLYISRKITHFGFKLDFTSHTRSFTFSCAIITKLEDHSSKQDTTSIHVRHGNDVFPIFRFTHKEDAIFSFDVGGNTITKEFGLRS